MRLAALALVLAAACSAATASATSSPGLFDYDVSAPLKVRDKGSVNPKSYPIRVHDISFQGPKDRVTGYLVIPPVKGRKPAVIFMHGSGGNRTQFLAPAGWIASRGVIGLTLDSPETRSSEPIKAGVPGLHQQRDLTVRAIVELRRAVDLLSRRKDVDPKRIAYVGWSYGARNGALLAGVEHRIASYDLMSGGALPPADYAKLAPKKYRKAVLQTLTQIDPLRYVAQAAPSALFLQDGRRDGTVPHRALVDLADAASKPKTLRWYKTGHAPNVQEYRDSIAWLSRRLHLHGVVVHGVRTGP
jgi:dienelactone hydrolase